VLRRMSLHMALRDILRRRASLVAFGSKRTANGIDSRGYCQAPACVFHRRCDKAGKKENAIVEVDEISKPVEYVTDECAKTPKETVWKKVENYVKKATKKL